MAGHRPEHTRGIVLTPAETANEGTDRVLDRLAGIGSNAVAISPGVFRPVDEGAGIREPPIDIDGGARILDRPLWGKTVQHLQGYAPYSSDPEIWRDVPFPMPEPPPAGLGPDPAAEMISGAGARGLGAYLIISPTVLPGLPGGQSFASGDAAKFSDDRLRRADGSVATRQIAGQGCVNNPRVQALATARLTETLLHYPEADGLFVDWAEYTCYLPEDIFTCFCDHCARRASGLGLAWSEIRHQVAQLLGGLRTLTVADLHRVIEADPTSLIEGLALLTGTAADGRAAAEELMRFKADSVVDFFTSIRDLAQRLGSGVEIGANGFAPVWNEVTGADFGRLSRVVPVVRSKLFTFHWPMMTRWLGDLLLAHNPELPGALVLQVVRTLYQVPAPASAEQCLSEVGMPHPDQPHPITMSALVDKLHQSGQDIAPGSRVEAYLHSYRPAAEFAELLQRMPISRVGGEWIQRYGYLSDEKLSIIEDAWTGRS